MKFMTFQLNNINRVLIVPILCGTAIQAYADDCSQSFPTTHNYCGYTNTCTIQPGEEKHCDNGSNGNHSYWYTMSPFSHDTGYFLVGAGVLKPVPKMVFTSTSPIFNGTVHVKSTLSNGIGGEWTSSEADMSNAAVTTLAEGGNYNYRYNIYIKNNSYQTVTIKYNVCAHFYGDEGPANGIYCGNLPPPPPSKFNEWKDAPDNVANKDDIYVYQNPYTRTVDYFKAKHNGEYWYFPSDQTDNDDWIYLGHIDPTFCIIAGHC
ncbi:hypothetical protein [Fluviispira vulneris]|uniref:hypothetical protein n=1 Tax=Fluviispira vulneris TaxID=2763012 RepID=UPI0016457991|nr:hypothetical protein [Fluviispira vulneris]